VTHLALRLALHNMVLTLTPAVDHLLTPTGQLFPDTDPKWKGARSDIFLNEAVSPVPPLQTLTDLLHAEIA
jgi:2-C-methyl-D-erythritol 2,4-cyclodiphosphate synthase